MRAWRKEVAYAYRCPLYKTIYWPYVFTIKFIGTMMDLVLPWLLAYMIDSVVPEKPPAQS